MNLIDVGRRSSGGSTGRFMAEAGADLAQALESAGRERSFGQGADIPAAGTLYPSSPVLVIREGYAGIVVVAENDRRTLLSIRGPGDLVGEQALFRGSGTKHGLRARSLTEIDAWQIPQDRFRQILGSHPQGWAALAADLQDRLAAAEERIALMASATAPQRLAVFCPAVAFSEGICRLAPSPRLGGTSHSSRAG